MRNQLSFEVYSFDLPQKLIKLDFSHNILAKSRLHKFFNQFSDKLHNFLTYIKAIDLKIKLKLCRNGTYEEISKHIV